MMTLTPDTSAHDLCELTPGQLEILNRLATIEAELTCCLREARRASQDITKKDDLKDARAA